MTEKLKTLPDGEEILLLYKAIIALKRNIIQSLKKDVFDKKNDGLSVAFVLYRSIESGLCFPSRCILPFSAQRNQSLDVMF